MSETKRILVAGVVLRDGRVLVMHSIKYGRRIEPSGGKWKADEETQEEGVVREMQEELGVTVRVLRKLGVFPTDVTPESAFDVHTYLCEIVEGEPSVQEPEKCDKVEWLTPDELERLAETTMSLRATLPAIRELLGVH